MPDHFKSGGVNLNGLGRPKRQFTLLDSCLVSFLQRKISLVDLLPSRRLPVRAKGIPPGIVLPPSFASLPLGFSWPQVLLLSGVVCHIVIEFFIIDPAPLGRSSGTISVPVCFHCVVSPRFYHSICPGERRVYGPSIPALGFAVRGSRDRPLGGSLLLGTFATGKLAHGAVEIDMGGKGINIHPFLESCLSSAKSWVPACLLHERWPWLPSCRS